MPQHQFNHPMHSASPFRQPLEPQHQLNHPMHSASPFRQPSDRLSGDVMEAYQRMLADGRSAAEERTNPGALMVPLQQQEADPAPESPNQAAQAAEMLIAMRASSLCGRSNAECLLS